MKKLFALLLALTMLVAFAGCDAEPAPTTEPTTAPTTAPTVAPTTEPTTAPTTEPVVTETVMTHAEFVAAAMDSQVTVQTYVQATQSWWDGKINIYAQSEDGGYYIYNMPCTEEEAAKLVPGTKLEVTGYKGEWSGEVEILDATFKILDGSWIVETANDITALMGTDELADHMNELVVVKGLTVAASQDADGNDVPYLYKWDGSGTQGDDIYFNVSLGDAVYTFTVESYMMNNEATYQAVEALKVGDKIDVEGFLYWYNGAQPHVTSVAPAK